MHFAQIIKSDHDNRAISLGSFPYVRPMMSYKCTIFSSAVKGFEPFGRLLVSFHGTIENGFAVFLCQHTDP